MIFFDAIFDFFSAFFTHLILIIGVIGLIVSYVTRVLPTLIPYTFIIRVASIVLVGIGLFLEGKLSSDQEWKNKVAVDQEKIKVSEEKANKLSQDIQVEFITQVKKVRETKTVIKEVIKENEKIINAKCEVPDLALTILNDAAQNKSKK